LLNLSLLLFRLSNLQKTAAIVPFETSISLDLLIRLMQKAQFDEQNVA